jgi:hypothetical protein
LLAATAQDVDDRLSGCPELSGGSDATSSLTR